MIIDVSFYPTFYNAEKSKTYIELIETMVVIDQNLYKKLNIYVEEHHIIPSFETTVETEKVLLPISLHFMAHYLRAKEAKKDYEKAGNYTLAYNILKKKEANQIRGFFSDKMKECEQYVIKWFRAPTFEQQFGEKRANIIKSKISETMKNLEQEIIEKRNQSIKMYAQNRPKSHNKAIAAGKTRKVTELISGQIWNNIYEAAFYTGISYDSIRKCCQGKKDSVKGKQFRYLRKDLYDLI